MGKIGGGDGWGGASLWLLPRVISLQAFAKTWEPCVCILLSLFTNSNLTHCWAQKPFCLDQMLKIS